MPTHSFEELQVVARWLLLQNFWNVCGYVDRPYHKNQHFNQIAKNMAYGIKVFPS